jgi:hypothetical protein
MLRIDIIGGTGHVGIYLVPRLVYGGNASTLGPQDPTPGA